MTVRVKICGICRVEDARAAAQAGAQAIGLVFAQGRRQVTIDQAARIVEALPPLICVVGVFVDASEDEIRKVLSRVPLGAVQLHGDEPPDLARAIDRPVIKAMKLTCADDARRVLEFRARAPGAWVLLDAARGGSGSCADWEQAALIARESSVILAGGLTAANVTDAIRRVSPAAVDVSSGVESSPGVKDVTLVRAFIEAARGANRNVPDL